jgi:hypothetical protein
MERLPDLTPFTNGQDWWNSDSTNAMLLISYESLRFNQLCIETTIDRHLKALVNES